MEALSGFSQDFFAVQSLADRFRDLRAEMDRFATLQVGLQSRRRVRPR
jgi:hypothetical protein